MTITSFAVALILGSIPIVGCFGKSASSSLYHLLHNHQTLRKSHQSAQHPSPQHPLPAHQHHHTGCPKYTGREGSIGDFINVTEFGADCLNWVEIPTYLERTPGKGLGDHNFCRNPDGRSKPWCFFRNNHGRVDWAYCDCKQGSVRLRGNQKSESEGNVVEVYVNGAWGSICSSQWDDNDASVICRQLELGNKGEAKKIPISGTIPAIWNDVRCRGDEENILMCEKNIWLGGACPQEVAAAVTCSSTHVTDSAFIPTRLVGGSSAFEGRIEVFHAGQWGTVCDDQWDDADAEVVCRQLGFGGVAKAWNQAHFGEGTGPILLDEVQCTGNELSIEDCQLSVWGEHNCGHNEDAGVSCTPLADGSIRLAGGKGSHEGRLEVFHMAQWGTVCDDGWNDMNTHIVCHQLGFKYGKILLENDFEESTGIIWLDDVVCSGKESTLTQCTKQDWGKHDCSHREDVYITCHPETEQHRPLPGPPLRLMDGETKKEGRVEIYLNGQWGTICDDGWTDKDASVVCRQLGYKGPAKARTMAYFGEGKGPIHVDNVKCTGVERSLADCIKQDIGKHNCRHSEDAGVICDYFSKKMITTGPKESSLVCGLRLLHRRPKRIIGGRNSLRGGWPWQVALRLKSSHSDGRLLCGATLISSCWVLTAAHCFKRYGNSTRNYVIRVGDYHTLVPEEYEEDLGIQQIIIHKDYRPDGSDYDIALIRLEGASDQCVTFSSHVLPACLPLRRERPQKTASNCYITGWGDTGRAYSRTLQQASVTLLPKRICEERYRGRFTGRMLCAGSPPEQKHVDSCQGDSGGPLVCERTGGSWVVYGVTSWGYGCGVKDSPGVYTKVSALIPWIKSVTNL